MTARQAWGHNHRRRRTARRTGPAQAAFDLLHLRHATAFTRQAYLLSGHPQIAERAVAHAYRAAWEHWPEVARDRDPAGWVRAAAHDYALSPWHGLLPGGRPGPALPGPPADRALLAGVLALPRPYRRCLLLHDGLGLDLAATAAETEASTAATSGRLDHAREILAERVPELRNARPERRTPLLAHRLALLLVSAHVGTPPPAAEVRDGCERVSRQRTGAAYGLTALVAAAVAVALTVPEHGAAPAAPDDARNGGVAPGAGQVSGPVGDGRAYLPELRSGNYRARLVERGGLATVEPLRDAERRGGASGRAEGTAGRAGASGR